MRKMKLFSVLLLISSLVILSVGCAKKMEAKTNYPTQPIKVIVPNAPGAGQDTITRTVTKYLKFGQPTVVTNMDGGSGKIATTEVMNSKPDGYTVLSFGRSLLLNYYAGLYETKVYEELIPVAIYTDEVNIMIAGKNAPFNNLKEFAEYAKKNSKKISLGVSGAGGTTHATLAGVADKLGIVDDLNFVIFPGVAECKSNLLGNNVQVISMASTEAVSMLKSGDAKPLAMASEKRDKVLPDVLTTYEQGVQFSMGNWRAFFAPKGTPKAIVDKLANAIEEVTKNPEFLKEMETRGTKIEFFGPDAAVKKIKEEDAQLAPLGKFLKAKK